jgi:hypothetical protein
MVGQFDGAIVDPPDTEFGTAFDDPRSRWKKAFER